MNEELSRALCQLKYTYTYYIRYRYDNEGKDWYEYHCADNEDELSEWIADDLEIDPDNGDEAEVLRTIENNADFDTFLSNRVCTCLTSSVLGEQYENDSIAYIEHIAYHLYGEDKTAYMKEIAGAILEQIQFVKQPIFTTKPKVNAMFIRNIMAIFGVDYNTESRIMGQLQEIRDSELKKELLLQLTTLNHIKKMRGLLDRMDAIYHLKEERSKYIVGNVLLKFCETCSILRESLKSNFVPCSKLVADYYGIERPNYRRKILMQYVHPDTKKNVYSTLESDNKTFWNEVKRKPDS
ncbi:MAG: hypothetical protein IJ635_11195 [Bacteroidaceae bacterium]|nr:hypothetical protein [Bacteroidaceae bacterium]